MPNPLRHLSEACVITSDKSSDQRAVASFYHLPASEELRDRCCRGLACFAARNDDPRRWLQAVAATPLYCLGQCHAAPARGDENTLPAISIHARATVLLGNIVRGGIRDIAAYTQSGGGHALHMVLQTASAHSIAAIENSGLCGRGGAGFPTGRKWRAVADAIAAQKYVVANADEGDPGSFSDRILLEQDPFRLIEAMIIAGITVGATQGFIYLRREYTHAAQVLQHALTQARDVRWLGDNVLGCGRAFDLQLVIGAGSYLCGEETAMLNAIEGRRPEARLRPPQITERGLFGKPTLVNNIETLCAIPWIIEHGSTAYRALGTSENAGTKLLSLNSLFVNPGLYEVELGISVRSIVEELGGGLRRGKLKGVMIGGPLAGIIPPSLLDTALTHAALHEIGCALGHGGVIAFGDDTAIGDIVAEVFRFGAFESCGKCTPCHLGTAEISAAFIHQSSIHKSIAHKKITQQRWHNLIDALAATSLCGHGRGLAEFAQAVERHYGEELRACFA